MRIINNVIYDKNNNLPLDMYLPDQDNYSTIVYFHGGGLNSGSKENPQYVEIAKDFVEHGYGFVSCNYRMYPNAKFPDYLVDAAKAIAYVKSIIKGYKGSGKIIVSGQSAGAWMGAMLMLDTHYLKDEGVDPLSIDGWIIESGQMTSHFYILDIESKLNPMVQRIDERAPVYFADEKTDFSKALFFYYDNDMPMRKEQNILLYKTIKHFNNEADVEILELPGTHCYCSSYKGENGRYRYVTESIDWMIRKEL